VASHLYYCAQKSNLNSNC